ncbi:MAG: hypothetical protein IJ300_08920 [Clostridia bacterium]|nr:hypothetical protein [Clostridia bacterium]
MDKFKAKQHISEKSNTADGLVKAFSCCFFGHRKIDETDELKNNLRKVIESLIVDKNIRIFLFGSKSEFNSLCHKVVTALKQKHPDIKRVYIRAEFPYITDSYKNYLLKNYEFTYYPEKIINAGRAAYVERNYEMIDKSTFCVIYYDKIYTPPRRRNNRRDIVDYQPKSGTKLAYEYAKRKGKNIINMLVDNSKS